LHIKAIKPQEIATELSIAYGQNAYERRSIKYSLHRVKLSRSDLQRRHTGGRPPLDDVDAEILSFLRKLLFSSVPTTDDSLNVAVSTIDSRLVKTIGLEIVLLYWAPQMLTAELPQKRDGRAGQLLRVLE
jgi:hypothetical protein